METAMEILQTAQTFQRALDWKKVPNDSEGKSLVYIADNAEPKQTETHAPLRCRLELAGSCSLSPICSHPIALSRLIQNCTRGHLHNLRVQSKYRKVQHSLRHVAGTGRGGRG